MPLERLARFVLLPELKLLQVHRIENGVEIEAEKVAKFEVCPRCAARAYGTYDRRWVRIKDEPVRGRFVVLKIRKRRFWCCSCQKAFTEPIAGIGKGTRTTARYRRALKWACETFESLKKARKHMGCSTSTLYRLYYEQLELDLRKRRYPWPVSIGIDEHKYGELPSRGV